jgi:hypothetical protein
MRSSTVSFVQSAKTSHLDIRSRSKSGFARSLTALVPVLLLVSVTACATKSAYTGHYATDLSSVKPGEIRTTIESTIGEPEKVEQQDTALVAWYVIDRGYVGTLEKNSVGEKILWAPVMAWGELVSLGLAGWMISCATPCQKGWLIIVYDKDGRVSSASEDFLPDEHPLVAECATSAVRGDFAVCQGVRENVRPSSLPRKGLAPDSDKLGQRK